MNPNATARARAAKIKLRLADEATARAALNTEEWAAVRRPRTRAQLIRDIQTLCAVDGIARLDLTADEYAAIKDAPEIGRLGKRVTATPGGPPEMIDKG